MLYCGPVEVFKARTSFICFFLPVLSVSSRTRFSHRCYLSMQFLIQAFREELFGINVERHYGRWLVDSCWEDLRGCHPQLCPPHCLLEVTAYTTQVAAWSLGLFLTCLQPGRLTERNQCQFTSILQAYSCFGANPTLILCSLLQGQLFMVE